MITAENQCSTQVVKLGIYNNNKNNNKIKNLNKNQMKANMVKPVVQSRLQLHEISTSKE